MSSVSELPTIPAASGLGSERSARRQRGAPRTMAALVADISAYGVLALLALFALFPLLWMALSSFKTSHDLYRFEPVWIPNPPSLAFYQRVLGATPFLQFFENSLLVSTLSTLISVTFAAMAGYSLARSRFRFRRVISRGILLAYIFPTILLVIPLLTVIAQLGLANTYAGLILAYITFTFPFSTWMMTSYFQTVPAEIEEAGRIDGASNFGVFRRLALPLAAPGLVTVAIFSFINCWNEFLYAQVILGGGDARTLPVGLYSFVGSEVADWGPLMASTTLTILPTLILFLLIQRRIVGGLTGGAVKG